MNPGSRYISCAVYHQLVFKNVSKLKCFIDSSLQRMDCIAVYESKTAKVLQSGHSDTSKTLFACSPSLPDGSVYMTPGIRITCHQNIARSLEGSIRSALGKTCWPPKRLC